MKIQNSLFSNMPRSEVPAPAILRPLWNHQNTVARTATWGSLVSPQGDELQFLWGVCLHQEVNSCDSRGLSSSCSTKESKSKTTFLLKRSIQKRCRCYLNILLLETWPEIPDLFSPNEIEVYIIEILFPLSSPCPILERRHHDFSKNCQLNISVL